jgi:hypothetical protein
LLLLAFGALDQEAVVTVLAVVPEEGFLGTVWADDS